MCFSWSTVCIESKECWLVPRMGHKRGIWKKLTAPIQSGDDRVATSFSRRGGPGDGVHIYWLQYRAVMTSFSNRGDLKSF
jgi:hypothetical protein